MNIWNRLIAQNMNKKIWKILPWSIGQNFSYFGQCNDFIYSFWNFLTFRYQSSKKKKCKVNIFETFVFSLVCEIFHINYLQFNKSDAFFFPLFPFVLGNYQLLVHLHCIVTYLPILNVLSILSFVRRKKT